MELVSYREYFRYRKDQIYPTLDVHIDGRAEDGGGIRSIKSRAKSDLTNKSPDLGLAGVPFRFHILFSLTMTRISTYSSSRRGQNPKLRLSPGVYQGAFSYLRGRTPLEYV